MNSSEPCIRRLRPEDIPSVMRLKEAAGWNQLETDWRLFLELTPDGSFVMDAGGAVLATSVAVPYEGPFGWIGMMLVHPDERRKGYGTRMLHEATSFLRGKGLLPALDATPLGRLLYDQQGFRMLYGLERRTGRARGNLPACDKSVALSRATLDQVLELDSESFGADRSRVLRGILGLRNSIGCFLRSGGQVEGYILGRPGSRFFHLGPWVARSAEAASSLLSAALGTLGEIEVGIDVPCPNAAARELAANAGLETSRTVTRMVQEHPSDPGAGSTPLSEVVPGGRTDRIYGVAGFEWG